MASPDVTRALNVPGRLCYAPSSLSSAYPHGGTGLGTVKAIKATRSDSRYMIRDEAFGQEVRDIVWCGENWMMAGILREWDGDALTTLFPNVATGATSQNVGLVVPGTNRPGFMLSSKAVVLLFSPDDPEHSPAVLFYAAVPLVEETLQLDLVLNKRLETAFMFHGIRDSSSRIVQVKFLKDLSL